jgi:hypothetical protein
MNAKKSFNTANPALAYIELPEDDAPEHDQSIIAATDSAGEAQQASPDSAKPVASATKPRRKPRRTATRRKKAPPPMKPDPNLIETRSKRVQVLMQPSVYEVISDLAYEDDVSVNEVIHNILKDFTDKHQAPR